jgi:alpha-1,3-mannosyltransferase
MKIIYLTRIYYPYKGGLQTQVYELAKNIKACGNDVEIITGDTEINDVKSELIDGILVHRIPTKTLFGIAILKKQRDRNIIINHIKDASIVHVHEIKFIPLLIYLLNKKYPFKCFLTSHGFLFHTKKHVLFKMLYMFLFSFISRSYQGIFCGSEQDFRIAQKYHFSNCYYIGEGIDMTKFTLVKNNGIINNRLFYYGRIAPNKGIENALKHFSLLPKEFSFIIAGTGIFEYIQKIITQCNALEIIDRVVFLGSIADDAIIEQLSLAEFVILPSLYEGFGLTLIESLAANKKIIAHNNESYIDILSSLQLNYYLYDFTDPNSLLLDKIIELRQFPYYKIDLSKYSWNTIMDKILHFYQK